MIRKIWNVFAHFAVLVLFAAPAAVNAWALCVEPTALSITLGLLATVMLFFAAYEFGFIVGTLAERDTKGGRRGR